MNLRLLGAVLLVAGSVSGRAQQVELKEIPAGQAQQVLGLAPMLGRLSIDVAVTDPAGNAVTGLGAKNFTLLDNGNPARLVTFDASDGGTASWVSVILVLDDADLPREYLPDAEAAIDRYLHANGGHLPHPVTIYRITSRSLYATGPWVDGNVAADELSEGTHMRDVWRKQQTNIAHVPGGPPMEVEAGSAPGLPTGTAKDSSIPVAMKALGAIAIEQRRLRGRKLLFWIGPGWPVDREDGPGLFEAITEFSTRLREARIEISIANQWLSAHGNSVLGKSELAEAAKGVTGAKDAHFKNQALQVLAVQTGGGMLTTLNGMGAKTRGNPIPALIEKHVKEASASYRLTFDPPDTGVLDEYHELKVEVDRPGLAAHTTTGYYDEPVFYDHRDPSTELLSVEQLEQRLAEKSSDRKLADELSGLELTERMSTPRLERWLKMMPGTRSREALTALADRSAFLDPPASELANKPAPDDAEQREIVSAAATYLEQELPRLPNFYATRTTVQFGEPLPKPGQTWKTAQPDRRIYMERTENAHVYFEDGKEQVNNEKVKAKAAPMEDLLKTTGTFGPILGLVLKSAVAPGSTMTWSHWENGASGPVAVFKYSAPDVWLYGVGFCCLAVDGGMLPYNRTASFHGEIAIDPDTGHIVRITVQAYLEERLPLKESDVVVEYGPVTMGGKSYFCPVRSISMARDRRLWQMNEWGMKFRLYGPYKSILNDVTFDRYHLFRSNMTILPGFTPVGENP